jgi:hypothetical protein
MEYHLIDIEYDGQPIHIKVKRRELGHDLVYDCYTGDVFLGAISPTCCEDPSTYWISNDIPMELVRLIGDKIDKQDQ